MNVLGYDPIWKDRQKARFQEKYFRLIKEAGFNHVRVNLHPFRDAKLGPDHKPSAAWFETLDWAVKHALANRLMVILDFHEFQAMGDDPAGNKERFLAVWRQIAEHCKDAPDDVLFEILNEPNKKLTPELWNPLLREALAIIRQSNPHRTVIVGPTSWNGIDDLDKLDLPEAGPEPDRHRPLLRPVPVHASGRGLCRAEGQDRRAVERDGEGAAGHCEGLRQGPGLGREAPAPDLLGRVRRVRQGGDGRPRALDEFRCRGRRRNASGVGPGGSSTTISSSTTCGRTTGSSPSGRPSCRVWCSTCRSEERISCQSNLEGRAMSSNRRMVSGGWAVGVLLGLGAWAAHDVFAAEPAGAPAGQPGGNVEVETLVQKLPETSAIGYGYSALFSGSQFLPYPDSAKVHTLVLGSERPEKSTLLEAIVRHGADAIPVLVEHLDDDRKTKIPPLQGTEWISYADEYDYNRRTQKTPPSDVNREIFAEKGPASHTPTVGDLCFVALGQIVNRRFNATRYQPSGGLVVSSPTYSTRLRSVVRADYADFTADKHRQMLIQDFKGPDFEDRRIGAYLRLTLYYPEEVERLVIEQLRAPTYDPAIIREFLHKKLYAEKSLAGRKALFDAFVKANGPVSRDAIQLVLFEDLERQEAVERGRDAPPRLYDLDARSAPMQLYAHGKNVTSRDVPNLNAWQVYVRARFIGSLTHDKSARIGDVVKGLFLESTGDDYFAPACLRCLASRGYGKFLTEQLNKIDVSRREDDALHEKYIAAVTVSEAPEVRDRLLEIVKTTPNVGFFMAALSCRRAEARRSSPAVGAADSGRIAGRYGPRQGPADDDRQAISRPSEVHLPVVPLHGKCPASRDDVRSSLVRQPDGQRGPRAVVGRQTPAAGLPSSDACLRSSGNGNQSGVLGKSASTPTGARPREIRRSRDSSSTARRQLRPRTSRLTDHRNEVEGCDSPHFFYAAPYVPQSRA